MGESTKRIRRVAVAGICVVAALALLFLVPIVPMRVSTPDLYAQHALCWGGAVMVGYNPTSLIFGSVSYALSNHGVVYVVSGDYLWRVPAQYPPGGITCA
jgi:hypothetical protein